MLLLRASRIAAARTLPTSASAAALGQWLGLRGTQTRPNQPLDLSRYIKKNHGIRAPQTFRKDEAQRLGIIARDPAAPLLELRPVPKGPLEFVQKRVEYKKLLAKTRARIKAEVDAAEAAIEVKEEEFRAKVLKEKAEKRAERTRLKEERAIKQRGAIRLNRDTKALRAMQAQAKVQRAKLARAARMTAWLDALEAESQAWITEDKIDSMITPDLFSAKLTWQYQVWFAAQDERRTLEEAARRAKRPGEPLREVVPADAEYARDWESESDDDEAAQAAVLQRWNDAQAAASGDERVGIALAAARRAARAAGRSFVEPAYDGAGALDTHNLALTLKGGGEGANRGMRLEELLARRILSTAEGEGLVGGEALPAWATADYGRPAPSPPIDLPEEQEYIGDAINAGNVPAVVYALLRRRARLARLAASPASSSDAPAAAAAGAAGAGSVQATAAAALARFDSDWAGWLASAMSGSGAPPAAPAPETDALLQHPTPQDNGDDGSSPPSSSSSARPFSFDLEAFARGVSRQGARGAGDAAVPSSSSSSPAGTGSLEGLWAAAAAVARPPTTDASGAEPRTGGRQRRGSPRPSSAVAADAGEEEAALDGSAAGGFAMDPRNAAEAQAMEEGAVPPPGLPKPQ